MNMNEHKCLGLKPQRIFCIGRNYVEHARELNNDVPKTPIVFMKPPTCIVPVEQPIHLPAKGQVHHEVEIVVLIGRAGVVKTEAEAGDFIAGLGLGLDLTIRDLQKELSGAGLPWERAKAFDDSAPLAEFLPYQGHLNFADLTFQCHVNGKLRQDGHSKLMIFSIPRLLVELSRTWRLLPGDLIYSGTPAGVGPLQRGDTIQITAPWLGEFEWTVASRLP